MKSTGIVRKVDELGRIVIPKELRRSLDLEEGDGIEVFVDGEQIILKKYVPNQQCMITGEVDHHNKTLANGKIIVSPEGALILQEQLKDYLEKNT